jgi:hypothetical protein
MRFQLWLEKEQQLELPFPSPYQEGDLKVVDTHMAREGDDQRLGNSAWIEGNELVGIHVTDKPQRMAEVLKSGEDIGHSYNKGEQRIEELGPGLYISAVPQLWMGRSTGKYDFAKDLTPEQKQTLADAILNHQHVTGDYLASFEKEYVRRDVARFLSDNTPGAINSIAMLAGQPYNIPFWQPEFLQSLGIEPAKQPEQVQVRARGRFADLTSHQGDVKLFQSLKQQGFEGAFARQGISATAQCCIWKTSAITKFGEYWP